MAGASAAYELAARGEVLVLEREAMPGRHSTGRSAALYSAIYGNPSVRALSRASRAFLTEPPPAFTTQAILSPRGCLFAAAIGERGQLDEIAEGAGDHIRGLSSAQALERVPILRPAACAAALLEPDAFDIDVDVLHQAYLRGLRQRGGRLVTNAEPTTLRATKGGWSVELRDATFEAVVIVNAAGAWADEVARVAGAAPLGLSPRRRTVILTAAPAAPGFDRWPCVIDAAETYYFKPDAGRLLLSPADETLSAPCDAQPEEYDVALAVDRFERATTHSVRAISHRWAGLRTFAPDRTPVVGFDAQAPGFFWLVGQGGYGIQTAPAMAMLASALAAGEDPPAALLDHGVEPAALAPTRLAA